MLQSSLTYCLKTGAINYMKILLVCMFALSARADFNSNICLWFDHNNMVRQEYKPEFDKWIREKQEAQNILLVFIL